MNPIIVREIEGIQTPENAFVLDLNQNPVQHCVGCWNCWKKTPGRCAFHDLDAYYKSFLEADKAIFYLSVSRDFVSSGIKAVFDRMIPMFLPYTSFQTGESMHVPRYIHYPDVEVHYCGTFSSEDARQLYEEYLQRTFYQFHIKNIRIIRLETKREAV